MFNVLLIFLYRFIIARHKIMGAALTGVGTVLGSSPAMTAEAVVSGTYFRGKESTLSDTTDLAPATGPLLRVPYKLNYG